MHRTGDLAIGELAVWVGVTAAHRDAAFAACRFIIDEVKARVPIWKHERYAEGDAGWLHPELNGRQLGGDLGARTVDSLVRACAGPGG